MQQLFTESPTQEATGPPTVDEVLREHRDFIKSQLQNPVTVKRMAAIARIFQRAWERHPCFDGDNGNPYVRIVCTHIEGPRHGFTQSISWVRVSATGGEMADFKTRHIPEPYHLSMMPVCNGAGGLCVPDNVYGVPPNDLKNNCDWYKRIPRLWDLPNAAGVHFVARRTFRQLYPDLKPALNAARLFARSSSKKTELSQLRKLAAKGDGGALLKLKVIEGSGVNTKLGDFKRWIKANPQAEKNMRTVNITPADIWAVANNKLSKEEVLNLGRQCQLL